jgi:hypothetical protein
LSWRRNGWLALASCVVVAAAGVVICVNRYQHKFVGSDEDLIGLLPRNDATVFFANIAGLRQHGYLKLLEGAKPSQEKEYRHFVLETNFDYTKDLNAVAGAANSDHLLFALRGHFHWNDIRAYVVAHGGACPSDLCEIATTDPRRFVSMRSIQSDVLGLAISEDEAAAKMIGPAKQVSMAFLPAPLWVRPSRQLLADPAELPAALRIFAVSLQSADSAVLSVQPSGNNGGAFSIALDALFRNKPTAETARTQLVLNTDLLKLALARQHRKPDPAHLSWLLTSGSFQVSQQHLLGLWTVRKELLASLQ